MDAVNHETMQRILTVEDDGDIRRAIVTTLKHHGYEATGVESGEEGLREMRQDRYDLLVLDVMLPGMSGFDVCSAVRRERPELPILMLTAKDDESDIVEGFRRGSDDYVTKPYRSSELVARVRALLRRAGPREPTTRRNFNFGPWEIDPTSLRAVFQAQEVELSQLEFGIVSLLAQEEGRIVTRRRILREIWGFANPAKVETRRVDMHIAKVRGKLDVDGRSLIDTVHGEGYRYAWSAVEAVNHAS